ncbi:MAG TPA: helix-turn-helix domain-containing protein [Pedobacter sp.]
MTNPEVTPLDLDVSLSDSFSIGDLNGLSFSAGHYYRISFNQLILLKKGRGKIQIDGADYMVGPGSLILLGKNQVYSFLKEEDRAGYSLCFGDCFWEKTPASANNCKATLFNNITANQHLQLGRQDVKELSRIFGETLAEFVTADYVNKGDVLAAFLKILMIKIANMNSLLTKETSQQDYSIYNIFLELIEHHYEISHDVSFFAGKLNISNRKLTELCRKYADKGAKEVIKSHLIAEAKRSLQFTSSPIKEIALKLNFSPYQFSHFFKKNTSLPPETYRKQFAEIDI